MEKLVSDKALTPDDFHEIARQRGLPINRARKTAWVAARPAASGERVETRWNGVETVNVAEPGDWIVTSLDHCRAPLRDESGALNAYVVQRNTFASLYRRAQGRNRYGAHYRSQSEVLVLALDEGFDIVAPWGERQSADRGYLLLNGADVYGNHFETFRETYALVEGEDDKDAKLAR